MARFLKPDTTSQLNRRIPLLKPETISPDGLDLQKQPLGCHHLFPRVVEARAGGHPPGPGKCFANQNGALRSWAHSKGSLDGTSQGIWEHSLCKPVVQWAVPQAAASRLTFDWIRFDDHPMKLEGYRMRDLPSFSGLFYEELQGIVKHPGHQGQALLDEITGLQGALDNRR